VHPLAIVFSLPTIEHNTDTEARCVAGVRNQFALKIHILNKEQQAVRI
jgi:hypothetical protein